MPVTETRLANGLTIISDHMPHVETVALGVWVATGARHESAREHGISHFIEHMAFKGTARRNARQIVEEIEEVGGELNAATSLDSTAFYARVLKGDVAVALEILADIMLNPTYPIEDLERERNVILQEIAATRDSPEEIVLDLLQDAAFPRQPLGRVRKTAVNQPLENQQQSECGKKILHELLSRAGGSRPGRRSGSSRS